ncbi:type II secretion system protein GspD [Ahniella affigens]|uniref:Type II secretion system protein GspD n=2 Tax=Ahniella affigens TaxID=2021234 RepID=A0A2P1PXX1_9GAMM|nr:type II secretion system protein GspD [Ahniella affigens]
MFALALALIGFGPGTAHADGGMPQPMPVPEVAPAPPPAPADPTAGTVAPVASEPVPTDPTPVAPKPEPVPEPKPEVDPVSMGSTGTEPQSGSDGAMVDGALTPKSTGEDGDGDSPSGRAKVERGTGKFINEAAASRRNERAYTGDISFNFEAEPVQSVIKAILGEIFNENYTIAPGVGGQVTFATAKPITTEQAMAVLEMLLAWNNATMVYRDGSYTVLPTAQAIPGNLVPRIGPTEEAKGYELRVVPLKFISATEMEKLLQPYARQGSVVKADNSRAMIVIAGTRRDLDLYLQTIEIFDVDWLAGMSVGVYPLERVEATEVVPELEKIFGEGGATPLAGMFRFLPIERVNAVMVITPQPDYLERAEEWVYKLDRGGNESGAQLFVYYVKNVKATDLAEKLSEVFTGSSGSRSGGAKPSSVGGVAPGLQPVEIKSLSDRNKEKEGNSYQPPPANSASGSDGIGIVESDSIRITSIEESNALMIRATAGEYNSILSAIKRLDTVPLQVHIEAKVLQVDLTNDLSFGVNWFFENNASSPATANYRALRRANPGRDVWNSFSGGITGEGGLSWTLLNVEAEAVISALQTNGNVNVLSAPSLVVLNNKEASINAGKQIAIQTPIYTGYSQVTNPNDPNSANTPLPGNVQYLETGVSLNVTPRVNPGGLVYLEIEQEESTPGTQVGQFSAPPIDKRTIKTEIAVQSGETVLLGGLIRESKNNSRSGVPGLARVPILGSLFGSTTRKTIRQELLVMITPTVIENAEAARDLTNEFKQRFKGLKPMMRKVDREEQRIREQMSKE